MRAAKIQVEGFRLLRNIEILMEPSSTVIVGRNNSGKTSLTDVFDRFTPNGPSFRFQDFSAANRGLFVDAREARLAGKAPAVVLAMLPRIAVTLTFAYDKQAKDVGPLSPFLIDLDTESTSVIARLEYAPSLKTLAALLELPGEGEAATDGKGEPVPLAAEELPALQPVDAVEADVAPSDLAPSWKDAFFRHLNDVIPAAYGVQVWAIDPTNSDNRRQLDEAKFSALLQTNFVRAQRTLDHANQGDADVIGKLLSALYKTAKSPSAAVSDRQLADRLRLSVESIERGVQKDFDQLLDQLLPAMDIVGFPGANDARLMPETSLKVEALLNDHTRVVYRSMDGVHLPEGYNGLGTRNLIYMLLQLQSFHKEYRTKEPRPTSHLIFVEEPEAHLHPQMQEVFIAQLQKAVKELSKEYPDQPEWKVQFVITTHSPHVANAATFEAVRYFLNNPPDAGELRHTTVKDFKKGAALIPAPDKGFLHQYMTLTKCDLYFADKAIMVEGATERILMPRLRELVDETLQDGRKLARQYVTTIEVGGAFAHLLYPLVDFLELKTLIITDLDSTKGVAKPDKNGKDAIRYVKCPVIEGERTANSAIRHFFREDGEDELPQFKPKELLKLNANQKIRGSRRIAYQVPELEDPGHCARSFEDALILANPERFGLPQDVDAGSAWEKAEDLASAESKADIALRYAINEKEWAVPRYIREGLTWLSDPPPPPTAPPPLIEGVADEESSADEEVHESSEDTE
ncbi:ATP-dependent endonuclease [Bacillus sp. NP157]|nr:ATP-dependent endonuclease [Bacillus sp. NP157]